jgi:hypothetical protein
MHYTAYKQAPETSGATEFFNYPETLYNFLLIILC